MHYNIIINVVFVCLCVTHVHSQCPTICRCDRETIVCDGHGTNTDDGIFAQITPTFFPELRTLIVRNNRFDNLDVETNLFGTMVLHRQLSYLDLSNNSIRELNQNMLQDVPQMDTLVLDHNMIEEIGPNFFWRMPMIRNVSIRNAFNHLTSPSERAEMLRTLLNNDGLTEPSHRHNFTRLTALNLAHNNLTFILPNMFCGIFGEPTVYLDHNRGCFMLGGCLVSLNLSTCNGGFRGLRGLHVSDNHLVTISDQTLDAIDKWDDNQLTTIDFSSNPWRCDCQSRTLIEWLFDHRDLLVHTDSTRCVNGHPRDVIGQILIDVDEDSLLCANDDVNSSSSGGHHVAKVLFVLAAIGCCFLLTWLIVTNRQTIAQQFTRSQTAVGSYVAVNGYHKLNTEAAVQPEFV